MRKKGRDRRAEVEITFIHSADCARLQYVCGRRISHFCSQFFLYFSSLFSTQSLHNQTNGKKIARALLRFRFIKRLLSMKSHFKLGFFFNPVILL